MSVMIFDAIIDAGPSDPTTAVDWRSEPEIFSNRVDTETTCKAFVLSCRVLMVYIGRVARTASWPLLRDAVAMARPATMCLVGDPSLAFTYSPFSDDPALCS